MRLNPYFTLSGPEATGKSTLVKSVSERLSGYGFNVITRKEPGNSFYGKAIRHSFDNGFSVSNYKEDDLPYLFTMDRADSYEELVRQLLDTTENTLIISDRSMYDTIVYQSTDTNFVKMYNLQTSLFHEPDVNFVIVSHPGDIVFRLKQRQSIDKMDEKFLDEKHIYKIQQKYSSLPGDNHSFVNTSLPNTSSSCTDMIVKCILNFTNKNISLSVK